MIYIYIHIIYIERERAREIISKFKWLIYVLLISYLPNIDL